jgi:plastocyanin
LRIPTELLEDSVEIKTRAGVSGYGVPTTEAAIAVSAYVEPGFKRIVTKNGAEVTASAFCMVPAGTAVSVGDTITWEGRTYEVIDAQPMRARGAEHHIEVYLKSVGAD